MNRTKRILHDIYDIIKNPVENIHIYFDENNIENISVLLIGNSETPYQGGFYFFDVQFPERYPHVPMKMKFITTDGIIRFHPNLYEDGKICLSLLGTWQGPKWTNCNTLKSVLLSIQSIMDSNPLMNEPGFERIMVNERKNVAYNNITYHNNFWFAVWQQINKPLKPEFKDIIDEHFKKNYKVYHDKIKSLSELDGKEYKCSIYPGCQAKLNYKDLLEQMKTMIDKS